jgi:hypothetical protein
VRVTLISGQGHRRSESLSSLLTPALREAARVDANCWIKRLRLVRYGAATMRERFTYRGESLWWFTEIYLHKRRQLEAAVETVLALQAARESGATAFEVETDEPVRMEAAKAFGRSTGMRVELTGPIEAAARRRRREHEWPSRLVGLTGTLSRLRPGRVRPKRAAHVAAFVHTAFWRHQDVYVGPVLEALAAGTSAREVALVGVGPRRNFRARRWWDPVGTAALVAPDVTPIERLVRAGATSQSRELWRARHQLAAALTSGDEIRAAATIHRCDLWPVLEHELAGAATVQWPWSARTMDETAAALEALRPSVVVTYAEAGGWGRALMLEARRHGVASVGIQHGFIYRHWLNYLHEPDEMAASGAEAGFPRPDLTLLYDRYAEEHLQQHGRFPVESLRVTGSARLEALTEGLHERRSEREAIRQRLGVDASQALAVLAAKHSEIRRELPVLMEAAAQVREMRLVIKPHPAETPDVYASLATSARVSIAPIDCPLADLLAAADVIVTKNSTVAIDGLVLGLPAVVIGLPNNLSPFVDAGVMAGADGADGIRQALESVLYDRQVRQAMTERAGAFAARYGLAPEPGAAARASREILSLAARRSSDFEVRPSTFEV